MGALLYFVLCLKANQWLPGVTILPELLRRERDRYVAALQVADASLSTGALNLEALHALVSELLKEKLHSAAVVGDKSSEQEADPA